MDGTLFWQVDLQELKRGYTEIEDGTKLLCLFCGQIYDNDLIYNLGEHLVTAKRAMQQHIAEKHDSVFNALMDLDKKYTGLSDTQKEMMLMFYQSAGDDEISKQFGVSKSTVRNYRFRLKERAKQARVFLTIMELLDEKANTEDRIIDIHKEATMIDERYAITTSERNAAIKRYFSEDGMLIQFPKKQKRKIIVLQKIAEQFTVGKFYSEKEVNTILYNMFEDYVSLRRYLIEYGFLKRENDGSKYWVAM